MSLPHVPPMQSHSPRLPNLRAFTLIELLTVIAIIGILAAIIIPTVGKVRDSARAATCGSNMRQVGLAVIAYANDNRNRMPTAFGGHALFNGQPRSWYLKISPYLGGDLTSVPKTRNALRLLMCPASVRYSTGENDVPWNGFATAFFPHISDYGYNFAVNNNDPTTPSSYGRLLLTQLDAPVNPSNTPLMAEMVHHNNFIPATFERAKPANDQAAFESGATGRQSFSQRHGGGGNVLFFDGHIERFTYDALVQRANTGTTPTNFVEGR